MKLSPQGLCKHLEALAGECRGRVLVGFSGGVDSLVLLDLLRRAKLEVPVLAVHVDHGLHPDSALWMERARTTAAVMGVRFIGERREVQGRQGGVEAAARATRYAYFESLLESGDWLLSAHHQDDQAETVLLNLLRGSGPQGLSGMSAARPCGAGTLLRPLLGFSREELEAYAAGRSLRWVEDPSNEDLRFDRNFLRHHILPALKRRWPAFGRRLGRSAALSAEAQRLLDERAEEDVKAAGRADRLHIPTVSALSDARQRNLLRFATRQLDLSPVPAARLEAIRLDLLTARDDARPLVRWGNAEARRYRDHLYLQTVRGAFGAAGQTVKPGVVVELGDGLGRLTLEAVDGPGIDPELAQAGLKIRPREGGERLRPSVKSATRPLKSLLREAGILPWMRDRIPLLFAAGAPDVPLPRSGSDEPADRSPKAEDESALTGLVAVGDLWTESARMATPGCRVRWLDRPQLVGNDGD